MTISRLRKSTLSIASNLFVADEILVALRDILSAITRYHRARIDSPCTSPYAVPCCTLPYAIPCCTVARIDLTHSLPRALCSGSGSQSSTILACSCSYGWVLPFFFIGLGTFGNLAVFFFLSSFLLEQWIELSLPCREQWSAPSAHFSSAFVSCGPWINREL